MTKEYVDGSGLTLPTWVTSTSADGSVETSPNFASSDGVTQPLWYTSTDVNNLTEAGSNPRFPDPWYTSTDANNLTPSNVYDSSFFDDITGYAKSIGKTAEDVLTDPNLMKTFAQFSHIVDPGKPGGTSTSPENTSGNTSYTKTDYIPEWLQDFSKGVAIQSNTLPGYESGVDAPGMTYANSDIAGYMNPFVQQAWAPQAQRMQEDQQMELNNLRAKGGADAWGTRGALQEDLSQRRFNERYDTAEANMLNTAYNQATGLAGKDIDTRWADYGKIAQSPFEVNKANIGALGTVGQVVPKGTAYNQTNTGTTSGGTTTTTAADPTLLTSLAGLASTYAAGKQAQAKPVKPV